MFVTHTHKGAQQPFWGWGYVCYLDCSDSITGVCMCLTHQNVHVKYVRFVFYYSSIKQLKKSSQSDRVIDQSECICWNRSLAEWKPVETAPLIPAVGGFNPLAAKS